LDAKGLVALWRESLLARAVLKKKTLGYRHHPQLARFRECGKPVVAINQYLRTIYEEAMRRGYHFNADKLGRKESCARIWITDGQLEYEWEHLRAKLRKRNRVQYQMNEEVVDPRPHPLFKVCAGGIASWELVM
jgi:hypothetical protein